MIRQLIFTALLIVFCERIAASPADNYYREYLESATASPADIYYSNNLRNAPPSGPGGMGSDYNTPGGTALPSNGGGPPTGPGGEEEGDNTPMGVPIGKASTAGIILMAVTAVLYKRKSSNNE